MRQSKIYPYPTVQYIPLRLDILYRKEPVQTKPFLLIGPEVIDRRKQLNEKLGIELPQLIVPGEKLLILAGGVELIKARYRGYYVIIEGYSDSSVSLFQIPAAYFYKDTVVFQVKNHKDEVLVSRVYSGLPLKSEKQKIR